MQTLAPGSGCSLMRAYDTGTGDTAPPTSATYAFTTTPPVSSTAGPNGIAPPAAGAAGVHDGYFIVKPDGQSVTMVKVKLFGVGADGNTLDCRVWGFERCHGGLWVPAGPLCEYQGSTLGLLPGAGTTGEFRAAELAVDVMSDPVVGTKNIDTSYVTNNEDGWAFFLVAAAECRAFFIDLRKGTCTNCNALVGVVR